MNAKRGPMTVYPKLSVKTNQETISALVLRSMKEMENLGEQVANESTPTPCSLKLSLVRFYFEISIRFYLKNETNIK